MSTEEATDGPARLKAWLERSRISQRAAAVLLGCHYTHVSQILSRRRVPGLAQAVAIERVAGIPAGAWVPTGVGTHVGGRSRKRRQAA